MPSFISLKSTPFIIYTNGVVKCYVICIDKLCIFARLNYESKFQQNEEIIFDAYRLLHDVCGLQQSENRRGCQRRKDSVRADRMPKEGLLQRDDGKMEQLR